MPELFIYPSYSKATDVELYYLRHLTDDTIQVQKSSDCERVRLKFLWKHLESTVSNEDKLHYLPPYYAGIPLDLPKTIGTLLYLYGVIVMFRKWSNSTPYEGHF